jgi:uncharacterized protein (DUF2336 family)
MMPHAEASTALITDLETSISDGSPEQRAAMLRRVTGLFLHHSGALSGDQVELFDDVIERLARKMESMLLRELAETIADAPDAPLNVTRLLGRSEISVARTILIRSTRLDEDDLVDIVSTQGREHLLAVAARENIGERVTDVLVERGDQDVARRVAANATARLSELGFSTLLQRAQKDEVLQENLGARGNLEGPRMRALRAQATDRVRARLLARTGSSVGPLAAMIDDALGNKPPRHLDYLAAEAAIDLRQRERRLGEEDVAAYIADGKTEEVIVVLARLSGLSTEVVERLWLAEQNDGLIIVARSLGFQWPTARRMLQFALGGRAREVPKAAFEKFMRLRQTTAQRVTRFWQVRGIQPN